MSTPKMTVTERKIDPVKESAQRAAMRDHTRRMQPGQWVPLPNGESVRVQAQVGFKYPGQKENKMLGRPSEMLISPKPDFESGDRYQWRVRTSADPRDTRPAETANLHRGGRIRYIETDEIDESCEFAVYQEYATPNNKYVTWQSMILCEIVDEQISYDTYRYPVDKALDTVSHLEDNLLGEPGTHIRGKTFTNLEVGDVKQGG